jgi:hypothetical protein
MTKLVDPNMSPPNQHNASPIQVPAATPFIRQELYSFIIIWKSEDLHEAGPGCRFVRLVDSVFILIGNYTLSRHSVKLIGKADSLFSVLEATQSHEWTCGHSHT